MKSSKMNTAIWVFLMISALAPQPTYGQVVDLPYDFQSMVPLRGPALQPDATRAWRIRAAHVQPSIFAFAQQSFSFSV